jgi:hypothetical protein
MNFVTNILIKRGILREDLDYHVIRAAMVIIFLFFGYQKWFNYEAQALIPYISNGPLIFWMYPVFGVKGATWFLGVGEFSGPSGAFSRSYRPLRSFRSSRMVGLPLPADSRQ